MRKLLAFLVALLLAACAADSASVRPSPNEVVGTYFYGGDSGPGETLVLHKDGTFESSIGGDLIATSVKSSGTWSIDGDRITFKETGLAPGRKPFHTFALTQTYKGRLVLVRGEDADKDSVYLDWVYRRQPGR